MSDSDTVGFPPHICVQTPLATSKEVHARAFSRQYLAAADKFRNRKMKNRALFKLIEFCGGQLLLSYKSGVIPSENVELIDIIKWHDKQNNISCPPSQPEYNRLPYKLFNHICGVRSGGIVEGTAIINDDKSIYCETVPVRMGLMQRVFPGHFGQTREEQLAATCEWLADIISHDSPRTDADKTIWFHDEQKYSIDGGDSIKVSPGADSILQSFKENPTAMETGELAQRSGCTNPSLIIKRLREMKGGVFAPAIRPGGKRGQGGYFIRVKALPLK